MKYFLFLIFVIATRVYSLAFIRTNVAQDIINLVFSLFFIGIFFFKRDTTQGRFKDLKVFLTLSLVSIYLSFFVSYLDWNQPILVSFIVSRAILWVYFGHFLIRFKVKKEDIISALRYFTVLYIILVGLTFISPQLKILFIGIDIMGNAIEDPLIQGTEFIVLYFYFVVDKAFNEKFNTKNYLWVLAMFVLFLVVKNRTTLFSAILIVGGYLMLSNKLKLMHKIILVFLLTVPGIYLFSDTFTDLMTETTEQTSDSDYARIKAFDYFVYHFNDSWYSYVFGNGFASSTTEFGKMIDVLKTEDVNQSDIGMVGAWSMYGSILIFIIYRYVFRILLNKKTPIYLKLNAVHFIFAFLMYAFVLSQQIVFFILWFYLYELDKNGVIKQKIGTINKKKFQELYIKEETNINPI